MVKYKSELRFRNCGLESLFGVCGETKNGTKIDVEVVRRQD